MRQKIICCLIGGVLFFSLFTLALAEQMIELPAPDLSQGSSMMEALSRRRSQRSFSDQELSVPMLSRLLWAANGINRTDTGKRTAPSAKNAQAIDIYVAMAKGLYRYDAQRNILEWIKAEDIRATTGIQDFTKDAPVNLIFVADLNKISGDQHAKQLAAGIDAGFISQNVYLFCAAEGLATVVLGWFDQQALSSAMALEDDQRIILTQPVGYPK